MSIVETTLIYVVIPAGVIGLLAIAVYGRSMTNQQTRYRPGRPWPYRPVWYVPHQAQAGSASAAGRHALPSPTTGPTTRAALEARTTDSSTTDTAVGGATGEW
jgi:hypothetical protein